MNKLPTKQIYLLFIIVVGLITLSVYSTYAIFTFEGSTSDIVSIHTPKSLKISENIYEYQQITVKPNSITTTDVDIYNSFEYDVCYSAWYKVIGTEDIISKVQVFEQSDEILTTSGMLSAKNHIRIKIVIINDNNKEIKVNLGTIGAQKQADSCQLNLAKDKQMISSRYQNINLLTTEILKTKDKTIELEAGYTVYKDVTNTISFSNTDKIYVSKEFTYASEVFTLKEGKQVTIEEMINQNSLNINDIYFCQENNKCSILYKISSIEKEELQNGNINYKITKYDKLIGYSKGTNGLRQVNKNDYIYYGDNPNNYVYYNCLNNDYLSTCELWRIIGFFYDEETKKYNPKIIRNDSIGKYQYDYKLENDENKSSNNWKESTLNKYLNEEYKFKGNHEVYLDNYIQQVERIPNLEIDVKNIKLNEETIDSKITLVSLSDFLNTSSCQKNKINEYTGSCLANNWLNNIEISNEWTITTKEVELPKIDEPETIEPAEGTETIENPEENEEPIIEENETDNTTENTELEEEITTEEPIEENKYIINYAYSIGNKIGEYDVNESLDVRPVTYLKSRILLISGDGSFENPYVIK